MHHVCGRPLISQYAQIMYPCRLARPVRALSRSRQANERKTSRQRTNFNPYPTDTVGIIVRNTIFPDRQQLEVRWPGEDHSKMRI